jgi:hypothetical protein
MIFAVKVAIAGEAEAGAVDEAAEAEAGEAAADGAATKADAGAAVDGAKSHVPPRTQNQILPPKRNIAIKLFFYDRLN